MLETVEGSPNGTHVYPYAAGEVYSRESEPPISEYLMAAWVGQGRAVEVDAAGNPVGTPASRRAMKDAPESAPEGAGGAVAVEASTDTDSPADAEAASEPVDATQDDDPSGPSRRSGRK